MLSLTTFAAALEGQALRPLSTGGRVLLFLAGATVFHTSFVVGGVGCAIALATFSGTGTSGRASKRREVARARAPDHDREHLPLMCVAAGPSQPHRPEPLRC